MLYTANLVVRLFADTITFANILVNIEIDQSELN